MKTELTIEQSRQLNECGISASTYASSVLTFNDSVSEWTNRGTPIFTLTDIIKLVPTNKPFAFAEHYLNIYFELAGHRWVVQYLDYDKDDDVIVEKSAPELIDALFLLCLWCIDKGYIDTQKLN